MMLRKFLMLVSVLACVSQAQSEVIRGPVQYIYYEANGGSGTMSPQEFTDYPVTLKANQFSRPGWAFVGWSTRPDDGYALYQDRESVDDFGRWFDYYEDFTLYAVWIRADTANGHTWYFDVVEGAAWIVGVEGAPSGVVTVPATLGGKPVKFIGDPACSEPLLPHALNLSRVTSITFPETLKVIGYGLFKDSALQSFSLPASLKEIESGAFDNCQWWKSQPNGLVISGEWLLGWRGDSGGDLVIPSKVKKIAEYALSGRGFTSINLPSGLKVIGGAAFAWWRDYEEACPLQRLVIPEGVTDIGSAAFQGIPAVYFLGDKPRILTCDWAFLPSGKKFDYSWLGCGEAYYNENRSDTKWKPYEEIEGTIVYPWNGPGKLTVKPNNSAYGSVSGGGAYVEAGKLVLLKATAKDGYVFTGWYTDKACTKKLNPAGYDNRKPAVKITMPCGNAVIYAKFNAVSTDKEALKFDFTTAKLATVPKAYAANAKVALALGFSSKSYPKVTASGLPDGLAIDPITGKITGTVKKPGAYTAKVTVTSAAGNKISQNVKINIKAPLWSTGTFYGYGELLVNGKIVPVSAKFTASEVGKVSGKVTYKGTACAFTANYASATDAEARFTVSFTAGGVAFKSAMSIKQKTSGLTYTRAHALGDLFELEMQKKVPLVQTGKSLAGMIGKSYTFTKDYKNAGLKKSGDKLVVKFCDQDTVKLSGIVNGTRFTGYSAALLACGKSKTEPTTKYKLNVPVVEPTTKYYRLLTFKVTIETATKKVTKVEKAFSAIE